MQLSETDKARIRAAIRAAEVETSGEIYCVIARACSGYRFVPLAWAALLALSVPLPLIYLTWWPAAAIYLLQLAVFLVVLLVLSHPAVRFRIVPKRMKRERALAEAERQFAARGLQNTEQRTGVLIFVSVAERYAQILADAGINQRVTPEVWQQAIKALLGGIAAGGPADGFIAAIEQCASVLAVHFPPGKINRDELPNAILEF